ncbi:hypothetical protein MRV_0042 [Murid herpesvirus 3]|uniref:Protein U26 n=2 Tax=Murid betaherpesvirus 3 TaxID=2560603 RepID=A0A1P8VIS7_9BETA|nr:hypothetical protein MRV_0042 [Murine roseolovirus]APZ76253.1 hypothetical protein MRV_0042 [Murid betaherpesvirus 3]AYH64769.1 hypothetical protein MRV_0042 [Murid herpesvirus 3]
MFNVMSFVFGMASGCLLPGLYSYDFTNDTSYFICIILFYLIGIVLKFGKSVNSYNPSRDLKIIFIVWTAVTYLSFYQFPVYCILLNSELQIKRVLHRVSMMYGCNDLLWNVGIISGTVIHILGRCLFIPIHFILLIFFLLTFKHLQKSTVYFFELKRKYSNIYRFCQRDLKFMEKVIVTVIGICVLGVFILSRLFTPFKHNHMFFLFMVMHMRLRGNGCVFLLIAVIFIVINIFIKNVILTVCIDILIGIGVSGLLKKIQKFCHRKVMYAGDINCFVLCCVIITCFVINHFTK